MKTYRSQSGAVFLLFITVIVLAGALFVMGNISINQQQNGYITQTHQKLKLAQDALLGYALTHAIPGVLPCPDITGDGDADVLSGVCSQAKGWLPFRTLGLDDLRDSSGEKLWYVIDPSYALGAVPFNSSEVSLLNNNGDLLAFALLAPNKALDGQVRSSVTPNPSNYLEGINSDADPYTVTYQKGVANNDQLLTYGLAKFWFLIESSRVITAANSALQQYHLACGVYPWAAVFAQTPFDSVINLQQGGLPAGNSFASDGSTCASSLIVPSWLQDHWLTQIQYQFCLSSEGQCLTVSGDEATLASAVTIAPGIALTGQNRADTVLSNYFENVNAAESAIVEVRNQRNHDTNFNDVTAYLP